MEDREVVRKINAAVVSGLSGLAGVNAMIVQMMVEGGIVSAEEAQRRFELLAEHLHGTGGDDLGYRVVQQVATMVAATRRRGVSQQQVAA
jgi:hypothetical protein